MLADTCSIAAFASHGLVSAETHRGPDRCCWLLSRDDQILTCSVTAVKDKWLLFLDEKKPTAASIPAAQPSAGRSPPEGVLHPQKRDLAGLLRG